MVAQCDDETLDGIPLTGFVHLTLTARLVNHSDADDGLPPDIIRHQFTSTVVNNGMSKSRTPGRVWSAGFCLGMDLARLAKVLRHHFADSEEIVDGFAYEMEDE